ncbi:hypothetical protein [Streptomyces sp. NPDC050263]|uniref:hypothetical protein n=1 Tax=Streptomyces sp. NPDC050263 TaxID=3155037 RepID=UPI00341EA8B6
MLPRVDPPVGQGSSAGSSLAMGGRPTPSGVDPADAERLIRVLAAGTTYPHLELRGVHAHLASVLEAAEQLAAAEAVGWATGSGCGSRR